MSIKLYQYALMYAMHRNVTHLIPYEQSMAGICAKHNKFFSIWMFFLSMFAFVVKPDYVLWRLFLVAQSLFGLVRILVVNKKCKLK